MGLDCSATQRNLTRSPRCDSTARPTTSHAPTQVAAAPRRWDRTCRRPQRVGSDTIGLAVLGRHAATSSHLDPMPAWPEANNGKRGNRVSRWFHWVCEQLWTATNRNMVEPGGIEPPSASHRRTVLHA